MNNVGWDGFTPSICYDTKIECQKYFYLGRNVKYLQDGKVTQESWAYTALRIASWVTGIIPLLILSIWAIAHYASQAAIQERKDYWLSLSFDTSKWLIPAGYSCPKLKNLVENKPLKIDFALAEWFANTGIPQTPFKQGFAFGNPHNLFSPVDGNIGTKIPPEIAETLFCALLVRKGHGDVDGDLVGPALKKDDGSGPDEVRIAGYYTGVSPRDLKQNFYSPSFTLRKALWSGKNENQQIHYHEHPK